MRLGVDVEWIWAWKSESERTTVLPQDFPEAADFPHPPTRSFRFSGGRRQRARQAPYSFLFRSCFLLWLLAVSACPTELSAAALGQLPWSKQSWMDGGMEPGTCLMLSSPQLQPSLPAVGTTITSLLSSLLADPHPAYQSMPSS